MIQFSMPYVTLSEFFNMTVDEMNDHFNSLGGINQVYNRTASALNATNPNILPSLGIKGNLNFKKTKIIKRHKVGKVCYATLIQQYIYFAERDEGENDNIVFKLVGCVVLDLRKNKVVAIKKFTRDNTEYRINKLIECL